MAHWQWLIKCIPAAVEVYLFGEVIIHDQRVSPIVSKELSHGTAGVRRQVLQRRRVRRRRRHHDRIFHGVGVGQSLDYLRHGRPLLTNSDVDAVELGFLVLALVESLLVYDGVNGDRRFATNTTCFSASILNYDALSCTGCLQN